MPLASLIMKGINIMNKKELAILIILLYIHDFTILANLIISALIISFIFEAINNVKRK